MNCPESPGAMMNEPFPDSAISLRVSRCRYRFASCSWPRSGLRAAIASMASRVAFAMTTLNLSAP